MILKVHAFYTVRFAFAQTLTVFLDSPNKSTNKTSLMRTCGFIEVDHLPKVHVINFNESSYFHKLNYPTILLVLRHNKLVQRDERYQVVYRFLER